MNANTNGTAADSLEARAAAIAKERQRLLSIMVASSLFTEPKRQSVLSYGWFVLSRVLQGVGCVALALLLLALSPVLVPAAFIFPAVREACGGLVFFVTYSIHAALVLPKRR